MKQKEKLKNLGFLSNTVYKLHWILKSKQALIRNMIEA